MKRPKGRGIDPCGIRQLSVQARPLGSLLAEIKPRTASDMSVPSMADVTFYILDIGMYFRSFSILSSRFMQLHQLLQLQKAHLICALRKYRLFGTIKKSTSECNMSVLKYKGRRISYDI